MNKFIPRWKEEKNQWWQSKNTKLNPDTVLNLKYIGSEENVDEFATTHMILILVSVIHFWKGIC